MKPSTRQEDRRGRPRSLSPLSPTRTEHMPNSHSWTSDTNPAASLSSIRDHTQGSLRRRHSYVSPLHSTPSTPKSDKYGLCNHDPSRALNRSKSTPKPLSILLRHSFVSDKSSKSISGSDHDLDMDSLSASLPPSPPVPSCLALEPNDGLVLRRWGSDSRISSSLTTKRDTRPTVRFDLGKYGGGDDRSSHSPSPLRTRKSVDSSAPSSTVSRLLSISPNSRSPLDHDSSKLNNLTILVAYPGEDMITIGKRPRRTRKSFTSSLLPAKGILKADLKDGLGPLHRQTSFGTPAEKVDHEGIEDAQVRALALHYELDQDDC